MTEERHFTVEEAEALLLEITPLLEELREAQAEMEERQEQVMSSVPTNGGGTVHREFTAAAGRAQQALDGITGKGIIVRDPQTGLIDFPAERDGETVYLCWRLGEERVAWWHPPETGFAGRQPL